VPDDSAGDVAVVTTWRRFDRYHPLVPLAIFAAIALVVAIIGTVVPPGPKTPAIAISGAILVLLAYLWMPKPALLGFALFILFYDTFARWFGATVRSYDEAVLPVLVLVAMWRTKPWRDRTWIEPVRDGALLLVVVFGIAASLLNGVPANVWIIGLLLMLKGIVFLYLVLWHHFDDRDVRQASVAVLAVGVLVLVFAVLEALNVTAFRSILNLPAVADVRGQLPGLQSIFVFPVLFAWFMAFVAIFLFSNYIVLRRWWMLAGAALFGAAMFLSGRRRAIVGLALALVAGLVAQIRHGVSRRAVVRLWLPVGVAVLVLAIIFAPGLQNLWDRTLHEWLDSPAAPAAQNGGPIVYTKGNPRLLLYQTSLQIASTEFPFGAGLGRFGSPMSRLEFSPVYAEYGLDRIWGLTPLFPAYVTDTFWPHILGEMGVPGLGAYIVFLGSIGVSLWRSTRRVSAPVLLAFCLGAWMIFINALAESVASSMYESPPRIYLVFGAIGIALVLSRNAGRIVTGSGTSSRQVTTAEDDSSTT
jgi:hypothetical protein